VEVSETSSIYLAANGLAWDVNRSAGLPGDKLPTEFLDKGMSETMAPECRSHETIFSLPKLLNNGN
jgi:hypothetical protein